MLARNEHRPGISPTVTEPALSVQIGIYGWRKRCLYMFILIMMVLIIINLALTIWILRVLNFTVDGMGKLRILESGIRVEGQTEFLKDVYVSKVKSQPGYPISVEAGSNLTIKSQSSSDDVNSALFIGDKKVQVYCDNFSVLGVNGQEKLHVDDTQITIGDAMELHINSSAGTVIENSIQTPHIRGDPARNLKIESTTGKVEIDSGQGIDLSATYGEIHLQSLTTLALQATNGEIRLNARKMYVKNLEIATVTSSLGTTFSGAYQICVCKNTGRLFLALANGECIESTDICT